MKCPNGLCSATCNVCPAGDPTCPILCDGGVEDGVCSINEGCGCGDCTGVQDSCGNGLVCTTGGTCGNPECGD